MPTYNVYQLYTGKDVYRFIKADSKEKAIEYAMADGSPDDQDTEDTETWAEMVDNDCPMCDDEYQCIECEHLEREEKNA